MELDLKHELSFAPDQWWINYSLFEFRSIIDMGSIGLFPTRLVNFWERSYRHSFRSMHSPLFNTAPYNPYDLSYPVNFSPNLIHQLHPVRDSIKVWNFDSHYSISDWEQILSYIQIKLGIDPVPTLYWGDIQGDEI